MDTKHKADCIAQNGLAIIHAFHISLQPANDYKGVNIVILILRRSMEIDPAVQHPAGGIREGIAGHTLPDKIGKLAKQEP